MNQFKPDQVIRVQKFHVPALFREINRSIVGLILLLVMSQASFGQSVSCPFTIKFFNEPIPSLIRGRFNIADTIWVESNDSTYYKVIVQDCSGNISFEEYTFDKSVRLKSGYFCHVKDTLMSVGTVVDLQGNEKGYTYMKSIGVLRCGLWIYYNPIGLVVNQERYVDGVMLSEQWNLH